MPERCVLNVDLAKVYAEDEKTFLEYLAFGDFVDVESKTTKRVKVSVTVMEEQADGSVKPVRRKGIIKAARVEGRDVVIPASQSTVLKVNFVDVQQGDGSVIETPGGKVILVDGGDNCSVGFIGANTSPGPKALAGLFRTAILELESAGESPAGSAT